MIARAPIKRAPAVASLQEMRFGGRLKAVRTSRRLRLKEIAEQVGCSVSIISKIENNKAVPSLTLLHRLVGILGINIAALFDSTREPNGPVMHPGARPVIGLGNNGPESGVHLERIVPHSESTLLQGAIHIVQPAGGSSGAIHHEGEEVGYVLEGELDLTIDEKTFRLRPGDSFFFRSELRHSYVNTGKVTAKVLWINTPQTF
jgi:mannose-6-phosphate isomerase-like protein (cupin superfamily)/DNA-binding XRE family transcriptional regulator